MWKVCVWYNSSFICRLINLDTRRGLIGLICLAAGIIIQHRSSLILFPMFFADLEQHQEGCLDYLPADHLQVIDKDAYGFFQLWQMV